jgi:hypothetical protein
LNTCPNCGSSQIAEYCAHCGQQVADVRMSVGRLFRDVLEDQFSLNSTLPRTLYSLFFKPGHLTREYFDLRIARYIPPFRLYLISTLLFFVLASFLTSRASFRMDVEAQAAADSIRAEQARRSQQRDTSGLQVRTQRRSNGRFGIQVTSADSVNWLDSVSVNLGNERLNQMMRAKLNTLGRFPPSEAMRRLAVSSLQQVPKIMFLMLPVYALLLKILYFFKKRYYVEHFVFALHVHAFMFLLFFVAMVLKKLDVVQALLFAVVPIYMLIAMKRVYQQGWIMTTMKWAVLGVGYMVLLTFGLVLALTAAVLTV